MEDAPQEGRKPESGDGPDEHDEEKARRLGPKVEIRYQDLLAPGFDARRELPAEAAVRYSVVPWTIESASR